MSKQTTLHPQTNFLSALVCTLTHAGAYTHTHTGKADIALLFTRLGWESQGLKDGSPWVWSLREVCPIARAVSQAGESCRGQWGRGCPGPGLARLQPQWEWFVHQECEVGGLLYTDLFPCLGVKAAAQGHPETWMLSL